MRQIADKKTIILFVAFTAINLIDRFCLEPGMTVLFWVLFACQLFLIYLQTRNTGNLFADYTSAVIEQKIREHFKRSLKRFDARAFYEPFIDAIYIKMIREGIHSIHAGPLLNIV